MKSQSVFQAETQARLFSIELPPRASTPLLVLKLHSPQCKVGSPKSSSSSSVAISKDSSSSSFMAEISTSQVNSTWAGISCSGTASASVASSCAEEGDDQGNIEGTTPSLTKRGFPFLFGPWGSKEIISLSLFKI